MSASEIDRFITDLKAQANMVSDLQEGPASVSLMIDYAQARGYDITIDDVKTYIRSAATMELTDEQIDQIAAAGPGNTAGPIVTQVVTEQTVIIANVVIGVSTVIV